MYVCQFQSFLTDPFIIPAVFDPLLKGKLVYLAEY